MKKEFESGYTLLIVLMVLLVLSVLTLSLLGSTIKHHTLSKQEVNDKSAFYIAEAGLNYTVKEIERIAKIKLLNYAPTEKISEEVQKGKYLEAVKDAVGDSTAYPFGFEKHGTSTPTVSLQTKYSEFPNKIMVTSTGQIGKKKRTLTQYVTIKYAYINNEGESGGEGEPLPPVKPPLFNYPEKTAVFVKDNIKLDGGPSIFGNIGTNKEQNKTISLSGGPKIKGSIYVPVGFENISLDKPDWMYIDKPLGLANKVTFILPEFPEYPTLPIMKNQIFYKGTNQREVIKDGSIYIDNFTDGYRLVLDQDYQFDAIKLVENKSMEIDVGDKDRIIVVNHLNVENGVIRISGTGNLTLMVKSSISMGSGSKVNSTGNTKRLRIFLDNKSKIPNVLNLSGSQKIYGSLYAKNTNIQISAGGGFQGNILTGGNKVEINGGGSALYTMINAPDADVVLANSGTVRGTVLGKSLTMSGSAIVEYGEFDIDPGEFYPPKDPQFPDYKPVVSDVIKVDKIIEVEEGE